LGTIGLIITPRCLPKCLQGVSRCDTGGLAARQGSFSHVPPDKVTDAVESVTCQNSSWSRAFSKELATSYVTVRAYVVGVLPWFQSWNDARSHCIASHMKTDSTTPDRRLWTWEIRLAAPPQHSEYEAIVLSPEAFKKLDYHRRIGKGVPKDVRI